MEASLNFFVVLLILSSFYAVIWQCVDQERQKAKEVHYWRSVYEECCSPDYHPEKAIEPPSTEPVESNQPTGARSDSLHISSQTDLSSALNTLESS